MSTSQTNLNVSPTNSYTNYSRTPESNTKGMTAKGMTAKRTVVILQKIISGIIATVCAIAAILTLPLTIPAYVVLRIVDQNRGVRFKGLEPKDLNKSLSQYPFLLTAFPLSFAIAFGKAAITGKSEF